MKKGFNTTTVSILKFTVSQPIHQIRAYHVANQLTILGHITVSLYISDLQLSRVEESRVVYNWRGGGLLERALSGNFSAGSEDAVIRSLKYFRLQGDVRLDILFLSLCKEYNTLPLPLHTFLNDSRLI